MAIALTEEEKKRMKHQNSSQAEPGGEQSGKTQAAGSNNDQTNNLPKTENTAANSASKPFQYDSFNYGDYVKSDTVLNAEAALNDHFTNKPGAFNDAWQAEIDSIMSQITGRQPFSYDVNSDALYQQYKDQYAALGKLAMQDTMGQAAAMTGGYGNSYAATAGNQAYQSYLSQLNDVVPELYGMALDKYNNETSELYNRYGLLASEQDKAYNQYMDQYNIWASEADRLTDEYRYQSETDYGRYADDKAFDYGVYADDKNLAYNEYRNQIADSQWQKQFDESVRQNEIANEQWNQSFAYQQGRDEISDNQWQQAFDYGREQDAIANQQWQASFDESVKQNEIGNNQWQQNFASGEKQYNYSNLANLISSTGYEPSESELTAAGMSKEQAAAYKKYYDDGMTAATSNAEGAFLYDEKGNLKEGYTTTNTNFFDENGQFKSAKFLRNDDEYNVYSIGGKEVKVNAGVNPYTGTKNSDVKNGTFQNGYQPNNISGEKLSKTGMTDVINGVEQNIWKTSDGKLWIWDDTQNKYLEYGEEEKEEDEAQTASSTVSSTGQGSRGPMGVFAPHLMFK